MVYIIILTRCDINDNIIKIIYYIIWYDLRLRDANFFFPPTNPSARENKMRNVWSGVYVRGSGSGGECARADGGG